MSNGFGAPPGQPPVQGYASPYQGFGASGQAGQPQAVVPLSSFGASNARQVAKWLKFLGLLSMIGGAIYCLSIVGVVVGWLPILIGYWQYKASEDLRRFSESAEVGALEGGLNNLRLYYTVMGVMAIVGLSLAALMILTYLMMFLFMGVALFGAAASGAAQ